MCAGEIRLIRNRFIGVGLAAALMAAGATAQVAPKRPETIGGHPNFNGIWQAMNAASWNLEAHSAQDLPDKFWELGAIAAIPAGKSMLKGGGTIPYLPAALQKRDKNRADWPSADPEA